MAAARRVLPLLLAAGCLAAAALACPQEGFDSLADFKVKRFLKGTWFVQQQVVGLFGNTDALFCSKTEYQPRDGADLSKGVVALSYANKGAVNGPALLSGGAAPAGDEQVVFPAPRDAAANAKTAASKLKLGSASLEKPFLAGTSVLFRDQWVIAAGASEDKALGYDWAVVSAGAPRYHSLASAGASKCRTGDALGNNQGLWVLSRKEVDPEGTAAARTALEALGVDTNTLRAVAQEGCTYGAPQQEAAVAEAPAIEPELVLPESGSANEQADAAPKADLASHQRLAGVEASMPAAAAAEAEAEAGEFSPEELLQVTQRVTFNVSVGGELYGQITLGLFGHAAPMTVANFVEICKGTADGAAYKGSVFHRVIKDFMIQGGDFENADGTGGRSIYGETFKDEPVGLKLQLSRGVLAMANAGKDTNGSQFFITVINTDWLNGKHVVFGRVLKGMDVVDDVSNMAVDRSDRPLKPVAISGCKAWAGLPPDATPQ